jgi:hypothetical protein
MANILLAHGGWHGGWCWDTISFVLDERAGTTTLSPGSVSTLFYGLCDPVVAERAEARLRPESTAALGGEVNVTAAGAGSVPRYFVECLRDKAFPIEFQREMLRRFPCKQVFTLDADHSPFYSATGEFVKARLTVADNHPTPGATKLW